MRWTSICLTLWIALAVATGCGPDDNSASSCLTDFQAEPILMRYADSIILPAYTDLEEKSENLVLVSSEFNSSPTKENLERLRTGLNQIRLSWQAAAFFRFGPAETHALEEGFNLFPVNKTQVRFSAQNKRYDFSNREAYNKGLPAVEYLLFGLQKDSAALMDTLQTNASYRQYAVEVAKDMKKRVSTVLGGWESYRAEFISRTGTSAGESLSLLVNAINQQVETVKRNKVGIPSGILSLGIPNPMASEAPYSRKSVEYLHASLNQLERVYEAGGKEGLKEVIAFTETVREGKALESSIQDQIATCTQLVALLQLDMVQGVNDEKAQYTELFNELNTLVVYLKSDMPSVLCISITYVDNPSDSD